MCMYVCMSADVKWSPRLLALDCSSVSASRLRIHIHLHLHLHIWYTYTYTYTWCVCVCNFVVFFSPWNVRILMCQPKKGREKGLTRGDDSMVALPAVKFVWRRKEEKSEKSRINLSHKKKINAKGRSKNRERKRERERENLNRKFPSNFLFFF